MGVDKFVVRSQVGWSCSAALRLHEARMEYEYMHIIMLSLDYGPKKSLH
jgi:hypothetical protein